VHHDDTGNMGTEGTEQSPNANRKAGKLNTYDGRIGGYQQVYWRQNPILSSSVDIFLLYASPARILPKGAKF
jgi:hypothetical protein